MIGARTSISRLLQSPSHPVFGLAMASMTMSGEEFLKSDEVVPSLISIACLEE